MSIQLYPQKWSILSCLLAFLVHSSIYSQDDSAWWLRQGPKAVYDSLQLKFDQSDLSGLTRVEKLLCGLPQGEPSQKGLCQLAHGFVQRLHKKHLEAAKSFSNGAAQFKVADLPQLRVNCLLQQGIALGEASEMPQAIKVLSAAYWLEKRIWRVRRDSVVALDILEQLYNVENMVDNATAAFRHAHEGEALARKIGLKAAQGRFLSYIADIERGFGEIEKARKNYLRAAELQERSELPKDQFYGLTNRLGACKNSTELRAVLPLFAQHVKKYQLSGIEQSTFWYEYAIVLLGFEEDQEAIRYFKMIANLYKDQDEMNYMYLWSMVNIHENDLAQKKYEVVLKYVPKTLANAKKAGDLYMQRLLLDNLSEASRHKGNFENAYLYQSESLLLRDSMEARSSRDDFIKTLISNQFKREKEIIYLRQAREKQLIATRLERQRWLLIGAGVVLVMLGLIAFGIYRNYQIKQRSSDMLNIANTVLVAEQVKLQRSNYQLRRFSSIVSHDILSNIDLILSAGNALVGPQAPKTSLMQYYDITYRTIQQLKNYCQGLLAEVRNNEVVPQKMEDPMAVVERVLARHEVALHKKNCQVKLEPLSPTMLPLSIVEQVFQNLISNAIRYGLDAPQATLYIAEEKNPMRGNTYWIVEDNGPGIAPELREAIFEKTTTEGVVSQGLNLGLGLLRETLKSYSVKIWVEDRVGGGARFVVDLGIQVELQ